MKIIKKLKEAIFEFRFFLYGLSIGAIANYVGFSLMTPSPLSLVVAFFIMILSIVSLSYIDYKVFVSKKKEVK